MQWIEKSTFLLVGLGSVAFFLVNEINEKQYVLDTGMKILLTLIMLTLTFFCYLYIRDRDRKRKLKQAEK